MNSAILQTMRAVRALRLKALVFLALSVVAGACALSAGHWFASAILGVAWLVLLGLSVASWLLAREIAALERVAEIERRLQIERNANELERLLADAERSAVQ